MFDEPSDQQQEIPTNFLFALKRYKWWLALSIVVLSIVSIVVIFALDSTYRSEALILVESQQIPQELVQSTVTSLAEERIKFIEQRVMTRDKLLAIAKKYPNLTETKRISDLDLVDEMRNSISVENITDGRGRGATTVAFKVAFESDSPARAQAIANDLAMLFLDENIKTRTARAIETTDFLTQESQRLKTALSKTEHAITLYKQKNNDALPEHLGLYTSMLDRAQTKSNELRRKLDLISSQKSVLEAQLEVASRPSSLSVDELRAEYQRLSLKYKPAHPDLLQLRQAIADAEAERAANVMNPGEQLGKNSTLDSKIEALNVEHKLITKELANVETDISKLEAKIIKIPQVEQGLVALNRDYKAVKTQYEKLLENKMKAQMAENLEEDLKAERFSLIEPPALPDKPFKPNRKKLLVGGMAASFGLPIAVVFLLAFLDKSVRGEKAIEIITGQTPIAVIGFIETGIEKRRKAINRKAFYFAAPAALLLLTLSIHFIYPPIYTKLFEVISRLM